MQSRSTIHQGMIYFESLWPTYFMKPASRVAFTRREQSMKIRRICTTMLLLAILMAGVTSSAQQNQDKNLDKAKATTDAIRQPDPPQASTDTAKASPVGQPVTSTNKEKGYKPAQPSPDKTTPPPSPVPAKSTPPKASTDTVKGTPPKTSTDTKKN